MERDNLWICENCLCAIRSHEGYAPVFKHYVNEDNEIESKCDWCEDCGYDKLYELI